MLTLKEKIINLPQSLRLVKMYQQVPQPIHPKLIINKIVILLKKIKPPNNHSIDCFKESP
jgi:hypothetical protein